MSPSRVLLCCALPMTLWACAPTTQVDVRTIDDDSYFDLGDFGRPISTKSEKAQTWFDRGLALSYGFNHQEAIRCFDKAIAADERSAMVYWGKAYALGPNINSTGMNAKASQLACEALENASAHAQDASPVEQALIDALKTRYASPPPEDRSALNLAYANAMREVHKAYPEDADVTALFAESLMILRPWNHWSKDGQPAPETPEIQGTLEKGLAHTPDHPALCHLYIHAMEASPNPGVALPAADRLRNRMPEAGHLVHMPSHIDVLVGQYNEAILANQRAIEADRLFVDYAGRDNSYTLYRIHNYHFVVYGAMFDGQSEVALRAAEELVEEIPHDLLMNLIDLLDAFVPTRFHVMVRFGWWDRILQTEEPQEELVFSRAIWRYARTIALASLSRVEEAEVERAALEKLATEVPASRVLFNNTCTDILNVARAMALGEVEYRRGNYETAFASLRRAVVLDDALNYDEPWGWMQPARHALGALLLEQGHVDEAEEVYRADLNRHPANGWALHGLAECLTRTNREDEAVAIEARIAERWKRADVQLTTSCYCRLDRASG